MGSDGVVHLPEPVDLHRERVAVVGESGSGKSTTAAALIGLLPGSGRVAAGTISFAGEDVTHASDARLRELIGWKHHDGGSPPGGGQPAGWQFGEGDGAERRTGPGTCRWPRAGVWARGVGRGRYSSGGWVARSRVTSVVPRWSRRNW